MKLTGELKKHVEETDSRDEKKRLIEEAGMELTDEEMDIVSGGYAGRGRDEFDRSWDWWKEMV